MREPKFSVNAVVCIFLLFAALILFFSVRLTQEADNSAVNRFESVEGTALSVRYSSFVQNGLYEGDVNTGVLRVAGDFGVEWGAAAVDGKLYINEYHYSDLGQIYCDVVAVDLSDYSKTVIAKGAILRGQNASGELVFIRTTPPGNQPAKNPLSRMNALWTGENPTAVTVILFDPASGKEALFVRDDRAVEDAVLQENYLQKTLAEVAA